MKKSALTIACVFILAVLAPYSVRAEDRLALRVGDPLPSRTLPALAGNAMTIPDDVKGNVTIVHFWTDRCGSCREVMPALDKLYVLYQRRGLRIVAVNVGQTKVQVKKFVDSIRISYPVLMDTIEESARIYSVIGLPRTYIVDRKGIVRYKLIGEVPEEIVQKYMLEIL